MPCKEASEDEWHQHYQLKYVREHKALSVQYGIWQCWTIVVAFLLTSSVPTILIHHQMSAG